MRQIPIITPEEMQRLVARGLVHKPVNVGPSKSQQDKHRWYVTRRNKFWKQGLGSTGKPFIRRWTGLSLKQLGRNEYERRKTKMLQAMGLTKDARPPLRRWTGLSNNNLGHTKYMRAYRSKLSQCKP
jgi:hypothetical protein